LRPVAVSWSTILQEREASRRVRAPAWRVDSSISCALRQCACSSLLRHTPVASHEHSCTLFASCRETRRSLYRGPLPTLRPSSSTAVAGHSALVLRLPWARCKPLLFPTLSLAIRLPCLFAGLGVVQHLQEAYPRLADVVHVYAISSGTMSALCLLLEKDPSDLLQRHFDAVARDMLKRPLAGFCDDLSPIRNFLEGWLPDDAFRRVDGRLHVVISVWPWLGFRDVHHFRSNDELVDAVLCSCALLGFVWRPQCNWRHSSWRGCWVDAAYQNILTPVDDIVDVGVRPYAKNRPHSLVPSPDAYHPRTRLVADAATARKYLEAARSDAESYARLRLAFAEYYSPAQSSTPSLPTAGTGWASTARCGATGNNSEGFPSGGEKDSGSDNAVESAAAAASELRSHQEPGQPPQEEHWPPMLQPAKASWPQPPPPRGGGYGSVVVVDIPPTGR